MKIIRKLAGWIGVILVIGALLAAGWYYLVRPSGSLPAAWDALDKLAEVLKDEKV